MASLRATIFTPPAKMMTATQKRTYDYAHQPAHPDDWIPVRSRELESDDETFELTNWLWSMTRGRWHCFTHYTPAMRQLIYFENVRDACAFKIVWGGE